MLKSYGMTFSKPAIRNDILNDT